MESPTQFRFKSLITASAPHGSFKRVAATMDKSEGDISRRFNPNDERKCGIAEGIDELLALKETDHMWFETVWQGVKNAVEGDEGPITLDLSRLLGDVAKETSDVVCAELHGEPIQIRRKEAVEAGAALRRYESRLLQESALRKVS